MNVYVYKFYFKQKIIIKAFWLFATPWTIYRLQNSPGQNTGVGSLSLLQGIYSTQASNPGLPYCRQILYQLSHQGTPRKLEWVACPFSSKSSWPGIKSGSPALQEDSLPAELPGKPYNQGLVNTKYELWILIEPVILLPLCYYSALMIENIWVFPVMLPFIHRQMNCFPFVLMCIQHVCL